MVQFIEGGGVSWEKKKILLYKVVPAFESDEDEIFKSDHLNESPGKYFPAMLRQCRFMKSFVSPTNQHDYH